MQCSRTIILRLFCILTGLICPAFANDRLTAPLGEGVSATLRNGRLLFVECHPPPGNQAEPYLQKFLADPKQWRVFAGKGRVAIPFYLLQPSIQRKALLSVFRDDFVDQRGWTHLVASGGQDRETLWTLCQWLTGNGANEDEVAKANRLATKHLSPGQKIWVPAHLLLDVMKEPTPERVPPPPPVAMETAAEALTYQSRNGKDYAVYLLKPGEALYSSVVVRFTDFERNADILNACEIVREASGIHDVHAIEPGTRILIPVELLSDRFKPAGSPERRQYEEIVAQSHALRGRVRTKNLSGVLVILDPGHGGRDHGARNSRHELLEDELNFDLVCRIKKLLEKQTQARVHVLLRDRSWSHYTPTEAKRFQHDTDEELLTTPPYPNEDAKTSANLRWYLANSLYRKAIKAGADKNKIVFTSIHCDALFDHRHRGAMVYVSGARYRPGAPGRSREGHAGKLYDRYNEVKEQRYVAFSEEERRYDEAISRSFAQTVLDELGKKRIRRHLEGDPIRSVIRQKGGVVFVPAVLRCNMVPTKILLEAANMTNDTDCERLADPQWRQWFAEAYVNALKAHFGEPTN